MNWGDKKEVKKGDLGEDLVKDFLHKKGFILYKPITNGSHKVDYFCHSGKDKKVICAEAKTKRRMALRPATGFNVNCYEHYFELNKKYNIKTFVFFIDDFERCIYGQWLHLLGKGITIKNVIVWPMDKMKLIRNLSNSEVNSINQFTSVNYDYSKTLKYFNNYQNNKSK